MRRDILYVDDDPENLFVFRVNLDCMFNVFTAADGYEALKLFERRTVPVVIADQDMPRMNGLELLRILRELHPGTRRVIVTGQACDESLLAAIRDGTIDALIKKPWEHDVVLAVLLDAINRHDRATVCGAA